VVADTGKYLTKLSVGTKKNSQLSVGEVEVEEGAGHCLAADTRDRPNGAVGDERWAESLPCLCNIRKY
jgi:hypothetical protein